MLDLYGRWHLQDFFWEKLRFEKSRSSKSQYCIRKVCISVCEKIGWDSLGPGRMNLDIIFLTTSMKTSLYEGLQQLTSNSQHIMYILRPQDMVLLRKLLCPSFFFTSLFRHICVYMGINGYGLVWIGIGSNRLRRGYQLWQYIFRHCVTRRYNKNLESAPHLASPYEDFCQAT